MWNGLDNNSGPENATQSHVLLQDSYEFFILHHLNSSSSITYLFFHQPVSKSRLSIHLTKKSPWTANPAVKILDPTGLFEGLENRSRHKAIAGFTLWVPQHKQNTCFMGEVILQKPNEKPEIYSIYCSCVNVLCEFLVYSDNSNTVGLTRFCGMILPCEAGEPCSEWNKHNPTIEWGSCWLASWW